LLRESCELWQDQQFLHQSLYNRIAFQIFSGNKLREVKQHKKTDRKNSDRSHKQRHTRYYV
jgi:hypothetical protein